jgi:hypothetical protein
MGEAGIGAGTALDSRTLVGLKDGQIEKHVAGLTTCLKRRRVEPPPAPNREPRPRLTTAQLQTLIEKLRVGPPCGNRWRWSTQPSMVPSLASQWIGIAIVEVTGKRCGESMMRSVLRQLEESGAAWPGTPLVGSRVRPCVVADPPSLPPSTYWERLEPRVVHRERLEPTHFARRADYRGCGSALPAGPTLTSDGVATAA